MQLSDFPITQAIVRYLDKPRSRYYWLGLYLAGFWTLAIALQLFWQQVPRPGQHVFSTEINGREVSYLLYLPDNYFTGNDWPLLLYLHGASLRGNDIQQLKRYGPPAMIKNGTDFPFAVLSPQCPAGMDWSDTKLLIALLEKVLLQLDVDEDRVYLSGVSLGGAGAWSLALDYPGRFAAVAPICGYGDASRGASLSDVPIWVFHGVNDKIVPVSQSDKMVAAIRSAGGSPKYTRYKNDGHYIVGKVYGKEPLFDWLLEQRR